LLTHPRSKTVKISSFSLRLLDWLNSKIESLLFTRSSASGVAEKMQYTVREAEVKQQEAVKWKGSSKSMYSFQCLVYADFLQKRASDDEKDTENPPHNYFS
jgi:hypothetical protein